MEQDLMERESRCRETEWLLKGIRGSLNWGLNEGLENL